TIGHSVAASLCEGWTSSWLRGLGSYLLFRRHFHCFCKTASPFHSKGLIRNRRRTQIANGKLNWHITHHARKKFRLLGGKRKDGIHRVAIDPIVQSRSRYC